MPGALDTVTDVLAAARITRLLVDDKITEPIRKELVQSDNEYLSYLPTCPMCVSVWAGAAVATGLIPRKLKYALALSEAAIITRKLLESLPTRWN